MGTAEDGVNPRQWDIREIFPDYQVTITSKDGTIVQTVMVPAGSGVTVTEPFPGSWGKIAQIEFAPITGAWKGGGQDERD